ncbi:membrane protein [Streptomyces pseudoechinosporeus]
MADTASRTMIRTRGHRAHSAAFGTRRAGQRHPLVATAMVLPLATLLVVVFGGWEAVVTQASSVGVMLGR